MPYVYANVKVKYGQLPAFYEPMVTIKRVMEENGWKLVGAWSTLIGDIHEVHDLWEVDDANTVPNGFAGAFEDPEFAAAVGAAIDDRRPRGPLAGDEDALQPLTRHPAPARSRHLVGCRPSLGDRVVDAAGYDRVANHVDARPGRHEWVPRSGAPFTHDDDQVGCELSVLRRSRCERLPTWR